VPHRRRLVAFGSLSDAMVALQRGRPQTDVLLTLSAIC
jgi:hypothetical protein